MEAGEAAAADGRAEIDTRAPFRSVREAVLLFGERVLAGEVYANKLNQMRIAENKIEQGPSKLVAMMVELEATKQNLERAREEGLVMANCVASLQEELEKTTRELQRIKAKEIEKHVVDSEIKDVKFVENLKNVEIKKTMPTEVTDGGVEIQKRRYVKFANPPSLAQVMTSEDRVLDRQMSVDSAMKKNKKKKPLIPLIGLVFSKKKKKNGFQEDSSSPRAQNTRK
ncbi:WEB family protein [Acorus gramineus]|uniref:WEB family protein n=1 Tax=Acorus gramineus TaxID=55184 RepID=A0AAV9ACZ6_ACOGR|nr:WEB family protein [Acorus gramineus]